MKWLIIATITNSQCSLDVPKIVAFVIVNLNIHKNFEFHNNKWIRFAKFFAEIDNIADKKYAASGNVVADSTADANKTLFFAGYGRSIYAGVTLGLF